MIKLLVVLTKINYRRNKNVLNTTIKNVTTMHTAPSPNRLIAFDFDHTIVDQNTDFVVQQLLTDKSAITTEIKDLHKTSGWTVFMQAIFSLLNRNHIHRADILKCIDDIPEVNGMLQTIVSLKDEHNFDIIIISDSNSLFIDSWCRANRLSHCFERIFTNPGKFEATTDLLCIEPYTNQTDCQMCPVNMCKGSVLQTFLDERRSSRGMPPYDQVVYVGDGRNDMCPIFRLAKNDMGFARRGYYMDKHIEECLLQANRTLDATLIRWSDGQDLLAHIVANLKE